MAKYITTLRATSKPITRKTGVMPARANLKAVYSHLVSTPAKPNNAPDAPTIGCTAEDIKAKPTAPPKRESA